MFKIILLVHRPYSNLTTRLLTTNRRLKILGSAKTQEAGPEPDLSPASAV